MDKTQKAEAEEIYQLSEELLTLVANGNYTAAQAMTALSRVAGIIMYDTLAPHAIDGAINLLSRQVKNITEIRAKWDAPSTH